jgi:hypothetical protein
MDRAAAQGAYGAAYLQARLVPAPGVAPAVALPRLVLPAAPTQAEIDRALSTYERYVWRPDAAAASVVPQACHGEVTR